MIRVPKLIGHRHERRAFVEQTPHSQGNWQIPRRERHGCFSVIERQPLPARLSGIGHSGLGSLTATNEQRTCIGRQEMEELALHPLALEATSCLLALRLAARSQSFRDAIDLPVTGGRAFLRRAFRRRSRQRKSGQAGDPLIVVPGLSGMAPVFMFGRAFLQRNAARLGTIAITL